MPRAVSDNERLAPALREHLESGSTLIVPSRQRAAAVRLAYAASQLASGKRAWPTPDVAAFGTWLEREAFRAAESGEAVPRPLRSTEEWLLWRRMAEEVTLDSPWPQGERLAQSLRRAARTLSEWHIPRSALRVAATPESEVLDQALGRLEAHCRATGVAASHELSPRLESWNPGRAVLLAGFGALSPVQRRLVERARPSGAGQREPATPHATGAVSVACAHNRAEELELAADWCCERLAAQPAAHLLVLIPDLGSRREEARRVFGQALDPHGALSAPAASTLAALALEGGESLNSYPLVRHALTTWRLLIGTLEFEACSAWLRGSFWGVPSAGERAQLDVWLRRVLPTELSALDLIHALASAHGGLSLPARALEEVVSAAIRALGSPGQARLVEWGRRFDAALRAIGWPGARTLSSVEQQTWGRLAELFAEWTSLGAHVGSVSAHQALQLLESLAARTPFAPATGDAAVTVSSVLGDPIVGYDGIWVTGMSADAWPPAPAVDPFIPLAAQRRAGIPWVTPRGVLDHARALLGRWHGATQELVLSWPSSVEDREGSPAPLLEELRQAQPWRSRERMPALAQRIRQVRRIEPFVDGAGDPWPAHAPLPGGVRALEYQARCPFRAYAELRLSCARLEAPRPGIDPRLRGRLLHRALELLWGRLRDSDGLAAVERSGNLGAVVEECVAHATLELAQVPATAAHAAGRPGGAMQREQSRAVRLLCELAKLERERPAFRVSALERRTRLELAGAAIDLRIDRIDELQDGSRIIFDYKSGRAAAPDWLAQRISDPQLLAYLLAVGDSVVALATIHLGGERVRYRGLADRSGRLPQLELARQWQAQVARWRGALEGLAGAFLAGSAAVDPSAHACRICHLHALCRIAETTPPEALDAG